MPFVDKAGLYDQDILISVFWGNDEFEKGEIKQNNPFSSGTLCLIKYLTFQKFFSHVAL